MQHIRISFQFNTLDKHFCKQSDGDQFLFLAHNGNNFDERVLRYQFEKCAIEVPWFWKFGDTLPILEDSCQLDHNNLDNLIKHFNLPPRSIHTSDGDVEILKTILEGKKESLIKWLDAN